MKISSKRHFIVLVFCAVIYFLSYPVYGKTGIYHYPSETTVVADSLSQSGNGNNGNGNSGNNGNGNNGNSTNGADATCEVTSGFFAEAQVFGQKRDSLRMVLQWDAVAGADAYQVKYITDGEPAKKVSVGKVNTATVTKLKLNRVYQWQVRVKCGAKWSDWTDEWQHFNTFTDPICEVNSGHSSYVMPVENGGMTANPTIEVKLRWFPADEGEAYQVRYAVSGQTPIESAIVTMPDITLSQLLPNMSYQWHVRVRCHGQWSTWPNEWKEFETGELNNCQIKSGFRAEMLPERVKGQYDPLDPANQEGDTLSAMLFWDRAWAGVAYQVEYYTQGELALHSRVVKGPNVALTHLAPYTTYKWRVRVKCGPDWSPWPNEWREFNTTEVLLLNYDHVLFVDMDGNDQSAKIDNRYQAWATPHVASEQAHGLSQSDTLDYVVYVRKGTYEDYWVNMPDIDMIFEKNALVWYNTDNTDARSVIGDWRGGSGRYSIFGMGNFYVSTVSGTQHRDAISFRHNSSLELECSSFNSIQLSQDFQDSVGIEGVRIASGEVWSRPAVQGFDLTFTNCEFPLGFRDNASGGTAITFNDCTFRLPDVGEVDEVLQMKDHQGQALFTMQVSGVDYRFNTANLSPQQVGDLEYVNDSDPYKVVSAFSIHQAEVSEQGWNASLCNFSYTLNNSKFILNRSNSSAIGLVWEEDQPDMDYSGDGLVINGGSAEAGINASNTVFLQADKKDSLATDIPIFFKGTNFTGLSWRVFRTGYHAINFSLEDQGRVADLTELEALKALYSSTKGEKWTNNTYWLKGINHLDFGTWHGIKTQQGDVTELNLASNALKGEMDADVDVLYGLRRLDLSQNELKGKVPVQIARLDQLEELYLNNNAFSGYIDLEFSTLPRIRKMHLYHNNLSSIPDFSFNNVVDRGQVSLRAEMNQLEFFYIENNLNPDGTNILGQFSYMPQKEFGEPRVIGFIEGNPLNLHMYMLGRENHYEWQYSPNDGQSWSVIGTDAPELQIDEVDESHAGMYRIRYTNDRANRPGDQIYSAIKTIRIAKPPVLVNRPKN